MNMRYLSRLDTEWEQPRPQPSFIIVSMIRLAAVSVVVASSVLTMAGTPTQEPGPNTWLAQARVAMGGEALAKVTSLTARGSHRRSLGSMTQDSSWEMAWQSPDKFIQVEVRTIDMGPMGSRTITQREGFNGGDAIFEVVSPGSPVPLFFPADTRSMTAEQKAEMEARALVHRKHLATAADDHGRHGAVRGHPRQPLRDQPGHQRADICREAIGKALQSAAW
jgi:hypothetical protein